MNRKSLFASSTVWLTTLSVLAETLNQLAGDPLTASYPKVHAFLGMAAMISLMLVRIFKTSAPILAPDPPAKPE